MKCPNCAADNEPDARFCENCGQPLDRRCPNCSAVVSAQARFCQNCGFRLSERAMPGGNGAATPFGPAPGEPAKILPEAEAFPPGASSQSNSLTSLGKLRSLRSLQQAAPQELVRRILAERDRLHATPGRGEGERKLVTALFTDIVGSTELAESMDIEDWREVVSGAHRRVSESVYRYEGTIAQLLGDGVLAFFGAPLVHEDDAERAVRAALDILTGIQEYASDLRQRGVVQSFQMRIGLNTGLVVVGNIGSDLHMEYLAVGDTINLAARMQTAASPGSILIADQTYRLAPSLFDFQDGGRIAVKGKAEPVQVYRVLGERKGAIKTRGIAGLSSPMVGREREAAALTQVAAALQAGSGAIVAIVGEAGLGKSRLVAEWRKSILSADGDPPIRWVACRCLSYGQTVAYHLATDLLRALLGSPADAPEVETRALLSRTTSELLGSKAPEVYPFLAHLLGLYLDQETAAQVKYLDGPALQARYVAAFQLHLKALAASSPVVIVCEDIHWADPSSVDLVRRLLPLSSETALAIVLVTRPDPESPGWQLVTAAQAFRATEIHLAPLTEEDSQRLVSNLLEVAALPEPVREMILAKSEGNPFYVEEVIRMLIDRGKVVREGDRWTMPGSIESIDIPDTLQGVIMARVDRLPEDAKRTLQIASVIGRRFQVNVLKMVLETESSEV